MGAEGVEVIMPPHERDKASVVASKHFCGLLLALQADGGCTHLAFALRPGRRRSGGRNAGEGAGSIEPR